MSDMLFAQPRGIRACCFAAARAGAVVAAGLLAGCSTAPRWETSLKLDELIQASPAADPAPPASPDELPRVAPGAARPGYRVGPQDELTLTAWGSKDLWSTITGQGEQATQAVLVQDDGTIVLPLLKGLKVEGLTLNEILAMVTSAYRKSLGESVQVAGWISRFRSKGILLDGAFNRPGIAHLSPELHTLGEAITAAGGGLGADADLAHGVLIRAGKRYQIDYQRAQEGAGGLLDIALQGGDRLYFPSRSKGVFYVFGEVGAQGAFTIPSQGISLLQGLAQAKGPAMITGDMESIFLIRGGDKEARVYQLTMREMIEAGHLALAAGDRIFVPPTRLADWDRSVRQLLPLFSGMVVIEGTVINPQ